MERKIRWVAIPGTRGMYQIGTHGKVRRISKKVEKYGIQLYQQKLFDEVAIEQRTRHSFSIKSSVPILKLNLEHDGKKEYTIASLMMLSFYGLRQMDNSEIIHIDGDEQNNHFENLVVANHIIRRRYFVILHTDEFKSGADERSGAGLSKYCASVPTRISMYDWHGNLKNVYKNLHEIVQSENLSRTELLKYLKGVKTGFMDRHLFVRGDGPNSVDVSYLQKLHEICVDGYNSISDTVVLQYTKGGKLVEVFESVEVVSKRMRISISDVESSIMNRELIGNYFWVQKKIEDSNYFAEN